MLNTIWIYIKYVLRSAQRLDWSEEFIVNYAAIVIAETNKHPVSSMIHCLSAGQFRKQNVGEVLEEPNNANKENCLTIWYFR